ncbi:transaldolase [Bradyrhizobium sp. SYSU BS000235]|uniref:transaldolase n=1 Tax=Bradyrhizobium sp. SYSU BS000235 TaxID=3411332 RepID=UPI003C77BA7B
MANVFENLQMAGVSIWLDDLSRARIASGDLRQSVKSGQVVGITTNPTIFARSISDGSGYNDQIRELALRGTAIGEAVRLLTAWDVRAACDLLRPLFDQSGTKDGRVSIEVDPRISADPERTAAEARGLWWLVDRPNLFIKIPATQAALPAITACTAAGISVNVTLIFSIDRYRAVLNAYMTGLEQRTASREELTGIESVASFFISRVDTEVDQRLAKLANAKAKELHGQAALANARLAYEVYEDATRSDRWRALAAEGGSMQRLLWASTGVKDKAFAATRYVTELVAPNTVNTMPEATLQALSHLEATTPDTISRRYTEARTIVHDLAELGIDLVNVADVLEHDGIASFIQSWNELIASVEQQLKSAGAEVILAGAVRPANGSGTGTGFSAPAAAAPAETSKGALA